jgi:CxxC-x17-CxxC domain-containing protein
MPNFHKPGRSGGGKKFGKGPRDFGKRGFGGFNRGHTSHAGKPPFSRGYAEKPVVMHQATCAECGSVCEVPFKPTGEKPIFCKNCFKKGANAGDKNVEQFKTQLETINAKLDKIIKLLSSAG